MLIHHGVVLSPGPAGQAWLYQATGRLGVHRLDLATAEGLRRFLDPYTAHDQQRLLLIEATPPDPEEQPTTGTAGQSLGAK